MDASLKHVEVSMNIKEFEAFSRGGRDWTEAFERAVARLKAQGGGKLTVPAGRYPTGSIQLHSDMTLEIEAGAELLFHKSFDAYPLVDMEY